MSDIEGGAERASEVIQLTSRLINCPTIFPDDNQCTEVIKDFLQGVGFKVQVLSFEDVGNVYAHFGNKSGKHLAFAGHYDVVPPGDARKWSSPPFEATIRDGKIYGRGVVDMKGAVAAFLVAAKRYLAAEPEFEGQISVLITGDEEIGSDFGMKPVLKWLKSGGVNFDFAIVGEPTSNQKFGDTIKIGRRGSINYVLEAIGEQGHAAYPESGDNAAHKLVSMISQLQNHKFDDGNDDFSPTQFQCVKLNVDNDASNVMPGSAQAKFNIRFSTLQTPDSLERHIRSICDEFGDYKLEGKLSGLPFVTDRDNDNLVLMANAVRSVTGITPKLSTSGGTSDARFLKDNCPLLEFGPLVGTAHKVDESSPVTDLEQLALVYESFAREFFA